ncbi:MAG: alpha/beta fold hydrolase [Acidimicrobiales bacterium]
MPQKYLPVDGLATLVHHRGATSLPGHAPPRANGEVVLCLHDAGDNGASFADLLDALAADHTPIAYDRPGHGRSASLDSLGSIAAMVTHLRGLAGACGAEHPVLVGEGLGGALALAAAAADPAWPLAVVLVGVLTPANLAQQIAELTAITQGKARRAFDNTGYAPDTPRQVYQKAFAEWVRTDPRATVGDRRAQSDWAASAPSTAVAAVTCPVVIVVGEHEDADAVAAAESLAASLTNANVTIQRLAGAGRHGPLEAPAALATVIDGAVSALAAGRASR